MTEQNVDIAQLSGLSELTADFSKHEEDYVYAHINQSAAIWEKLPLSALIRFNAMGLILCKKGEINVNLNAVKHQLSANTLLLVSPDSVLKGESFDKSQEIDLYLVFFSHRFMQNITIDINSVNNRLVVPRGVPIFTLTDIEIDFMIKLLLLLQDNANYPKQEQTEVYSRNIAQSTISSLIYHIMRMLSDRFEQEPVESKSMMRTDYVRNFISLVYKYHKTQRLVSFYADNLFITAKYLSMLVKKATGRTAAQWIDDYVIMEAKRMLRFSGKNVQQVAYELNFVSQSSFGKYFKRITGMSPSDFIKNK